MTGTSHAASLRSNEMGGIKMETINIFLGILKLILESFNA